MFLLSLLTNKDSYNTQIIQCINDTIFRKRFRVPGFGTGSGTLEPVPCNRFLRQITSCRSVVATGLSKISPDFLSKKTQNNPYKEISSNLQIPPKLTPKCCIILH